MNFIGRHLSLFGILLLTVFVGAAAGLYFDLPTRLQRARSASHTTQTYTCPMHPEVVQDHPGNCPKCGMTLGASKQAAAQGDQCGANGTNHPDCCADKQPATIQLPPGHPPVPGFTVATNTPVDSTVSAD